MMDANIQKSPFHLQRQIDDMFVNQPRQLAFRAQSLDEFNRWKATLRAKFFDLLGIAGRVPPAHPKAENKSITSYKNFTLPQMSLMYLKHDKYTQ